MHADSFIRCSACPSPPYCLTQCWDKTKAELAQHGQTLRPYAPAAPAPEAEPEYRRPTSIADDPGSWFNGVKRG